MPGGDGESATTTTNDDFVGSGHKSHGGRPPPVSDVVAFSFDDDGFLFDDAVSFATGQEEVEHDGPPPQQAALAFPSTSVRPIPPKSLADPGAALTHEELVALTSHSATYGQTFRTKQDQIAAELRARKTAASHKLVWTAGSSCAKTLVGDGDASEPVEVGLGVGQGHGNDGIHGNDGMWWGPTTRLRQVLAAARKSASFLFPKDANVSDPKTLPPRPKTSNLGSKTTHEQHSPIIRHSRHQTPENTKKGPQKQDTSRRSGDLGEAEEVNINTTLIPWELATVRMIGSTTDSVGLMLYFEFLRRGGLAFFVWSLFSCFLMHACGSDSGSGDDLTGAWGLIKLSLASFGDAGELAEDLPTTPAATDVGGRTVNNHPGTTTSYARYNERRIKLGIIDEEKAQKADWTRTVDITPWLGWLGALGGLCFFVFLFHFVRVKIPKELEAADAAAVTPGDFTVLVDRLPHFEPKRDFTDAGGEELADVAGDQHQTDRGNLFTTASNAKEQLRKTGYRWTPDRAYELSLKKHLCAVLTFEKLRRKARESPKYVYHDPKWGKVCARGYFGETTLHMLEAIDPLGVVTKQLKAVAEKGLNIRGNNKTKKDNLEGAITRPLDLDRLESLERFSEQLTEAEVNEIIPEISFARDIGGRLLERMEEARLVGEIVEAELDRWEGGGSGEGGLVASSASSCSCVSGGSCQEAREDGGDAVDALGEKAERAAGQRNEQSATLKRLQKRARKLVAQRKELREADEYLRQQMDAEIDDLEIEEHEQQASTGARKSRRDSDVSSRAAPLINPHPEFFESRPRQQGTDSTTTPTALLTPATPQTTARKHQLAQRHRHKLLPETERRIFRAYVSFNLAKDRDIILDAYRTSGYFFGWLLQHRRLRIPLNHVPSITEALKQAKAMAIRSPPYFSPTSSSPVGGGSPGSFSSGVGSTSRSTSSAQPQEHHQRQGRIRALFHQTTAFFHQYVGQHLHHSRSSIETREEESRDEQQRLFNFYRRQFRNFHPLDHRKRVRVRPAPEPDVILWENQDCKRSEFWLRRSVGAISIFLKLSLSAYCLFRVQKEQQRAADLSLGKDCPTNVLARILTLTPVGEHRPHCEGKGWWRDVDSLEQAAAVQGGATANLAVMAVNNSLSNATLPLTSLATSAAFSALAHSFSVELDASHAENFLQTQIMGNATTQPLLDNYLCNCECSKIGVSNLNGFLLQKACRDFIEELDWSFFLTVAISALVIVLNFLMHTVLVMLARFERPLTTSSLETNLALKCFISLFLNTSVIVFVINLDMRHVGYLGFIFTSSAPDFSYAWYVTVGFSITATMFLNIPSPHFLELLKAYGFDVLTSVAYRLGFLGKTEKALTAAYEPMEFDLAPRVGYLLNLLCSTVVFAPGCPVLLVFACLNLWSCFHVDKCLLLRVCKKPPQYDAECLRWALHLVFYAMLAHGMMGMWMLGNQDVFPSEHLWKQTHPTEDDHGGEKKMGDGTGAGESDGGFLMIGGRPFVVLWNRAFFAATLPYFLLTILVAGVIFSSTLHTLLGMRFSAVVAKMRAKIKQKMDYYNLWNRLFTCEASCCRGRSNELVSDGARKGDQSGPAKAMDHLQDPQVSSTQKTSVEMSSPASSHLSSRNLRQTRALPKTTTGLHKNESYVHKLYRKFCEIFAVNANPDDHAEHRTTYREAQREWRLSGAYPPSYFVADNDRYGGQNLRGQNARHSAKTIIDLEVFAETGKVVRKRKATEDFLAAA